MKAFCNDVKTKRLYFEDLPMPVIEAVDEVKIKVLYVTIGPEDVLWRFNPQNLYSSGVLGVEWTGEVI